MKFTYKNILRLSLIIPNLITLERQFNMYIIVYLIIFEDFLNIIINFR